MERVNVIKGAVDLWFERAVDAAGIMARRATSKRRDTLKSATECMEMRMRFLFDTMFQLENERAGAAPETDLDAAIERYSQIVAAGTAQILCAVGAGRPSQRAGRIKRVCASAGVAGTMNLVGEHHNCRVMTAAAKRCPVRK